MRVKFYGTRGSVPVAGPESVRTGGNTTCVEIQSQCLPKGTALVVDAGSGYMKFSKAATDMGVKTVHVLFTHYHHDHTQGILLSPLTYMEDGRTVCWGPVEDGFGPRKMLEVVMRRPLHPVDFGMVASRFQCRDIELPCTKIIVFHPTGGAQMISLEDYERVLRTKRPVVSFGKGRVKVLVSECLVVRMHYSNHPERTICYRFEEMPTGRVFVFLTDHENQDVLPKDMQRHLKGAHLLVMDSQYTRDVYNGRTSGFGHGTPDYCMEVALQAEAEKLGLTHHDPSATDDDVDKMGKDAVAEAKRLMPMHVEAGHMVGTPKVLVCRDYDTVEV